MRPHRSVPPMRRSISASRPTKRLTILSRAAFVGCGRRRRDASEANNPAVGENHVEPLVNPDDPRSPVRHSADRKGGADPANVKTASAGSLTRGFLWWPVRSGHRCAAGKSMLRTCLRTASLSSVLRVVLSR